MPRLHFGARGMAYLDGRAIARIRRNGLGAWVAEAKHGTFSGKLRGEWRTEAHARALVIHAAGQITELVDGRPALVAAIA